MTAELIWYGYPELDDPSPKRGRPKGSRNATRKRASAVLSNGDHLTITPADERDSAIIIASLFGYSMQSIGDEHGVSRERVRQILADYGITARKSNNKNGRTKIQHLTMEEAKASLDERFAWRDSMRQHRKEKRRAQVVVLRQLVEQLGRAPTYGEASAVFGCPIQYVLAYWRSRHAQSKHPTPYRIAAKRFYAMAGVKPRSTGTPGHRGLA